VYRFLPPPTGRPAVAPTPNNSWEQAERILGIVERGQAAPDVPVESADFPKPMGLDAWLSRPLRESDYLRAYGITPDDEFWDRYDPGGSNLGLGHGAGRRTWEHRPERPWQQAPPIDPFGNEQAPTAQGRPAGGDVDGGLPYAPPPRAQTPVDESPRIVAVMPHRSDHDITEDILAKLAEDAGAPESNARPETSSGISNLYGLIGSAEAQSRNRGSRPALTPAQQVHRDVYGLLHRRLSAIEPANPMLTTIQPHGYVPSREDVNQLWREWIEAQGRATRGGAAATSGLSWSPSSSTGRRDRVHDRRTCGAQRDPGQIA
jgi:hypothetical protein